MILLDTHAALWASVEPDRLGPESRNMIDEALDEGEVSVSAISFWEIALLVSKGRLSDKISASSIRDQVLHAGVAELPLTGTLAILSVSLKDMHGDPADRFIAATAIAHSAMLVTADRRLLNWSSSLRTQDALI